MLPDTLSKILLINKPKNWTSFDVVKKIRGLIKKKYSIDKIKVGHSGTLDPLASGLLIICTGSKTKDIKQFEPLEKEYIATIKLGCITASFDAETKETNHKPYNHILEQDVESLFIKLTGKLKQFPPIFSAIKIKGERLYKKARRGEKNIELKKRSITIYKLTLIEINLPFIKFRVKCSKGTYIRTLAHDIGQQFACGAYLYQLIRTQIGKYNLQNAIHMNNIDNSL
jgi:tRNA pseudouridine55 synthase